MCICISGGCLDKYIRIATWPPQTKFFGSTLAIFQVKIQRIQTTYLKLLFDHFRMYQSMIVDLNDLACTSTLFLNLTHAAMC